MAIYELEERVFFDGAIAVDAAEINEEVTVEDTQDTLNFLESETVSESTDDNTSEDSDSDTVAASGDVSEIEAEVVYDTSNDILDNLDVFDYADFSDIDLNDDYNVLLVSSDNDSIDEISASLNDNTILIEYSSSDSIESILEHIKAELGDNILVNAGIVTGNQSSVDSSQTFAELTDALKEIQTIDGQTEILDLALGSDDIDTDSNLTEFFDTDSSRFSSFIDSLTADNSQLTNDIYFIDSQVDDADQVIADILAEDSDAIIVELGEGEGVDEITDIINSYTDIDSIHIVSQGNYAQILLGDDVITSDNISDYQEVFSEWSDNLSENADILFYGCEIAEETQGQEVLNQIAEWTGADIAASTDVTGGDGGNWDLEFSMGAIEASAISVADYDHHLETYTVTETADNGSGTVIGTLSWAIAQSNATTAVDDTINFNLAEGTTVTVAGNGLTISDGLTINGNGVTIAFEDGNAALVINDGAADSQINVSINDLTIANSYADTASVNNFEDLTITASNIDGIDYIFAHISNEDATPKVLLVSSYLEDVDDLVAAAKDNVIVLEYNPETTDLTELNGMVIMALSGRKASSIAIATHNSGDNEFFLTDSETISLASTLTDTDQQQFWNNLALNLIEDGRIDLLACNLAAGTAGEILIASLENITGVNFAASTDETGNTENGGNWILETDNINAEEYFDSVAIKDYTELMWTDGTQITTPIGVDNFCGSISVSDDGLTVVVGGGGKAFVYTNGDWTSYTELVNDDSLPSFGCSVSVSGDGSTIVVGANTEDAVLIYRGSNWTLDNMVYGATKFGTSVSVSDNGNIAVIGADEAAYVYNFIDDSSSTLAKPGGASGFGKSVSISDDGTTVVVGAMWGNSTACIYINSNWNTPITLVNSYGASGFGSSVSVSGDGTTVVVGASYDSKAYVFTNSTWTACTELAAPSGTSFFGCSVSVSDDGSTVVVGSYDSGQAFVYTDGNWSTYTELDNHSADGFGKSVFVAGNGETIVAGAPTANEAFVYIATTPAPPELTSFSFTEIADQLIDEPFSITITAKDQYGNTYDYDGTAILSDSLTTDTAQITFVDGVYTGNIIITVAGTDTLTATAGEISSDSNSFSVETAYYRTNASGSWNWSVAANWQISTDGGKTWDTATEAPDADNSTSITILSGADVIVDASTYSSIANKLSIDQTTVNSGGTITVESGAYFNIGDGDGVDLTVTGSLTNSGNFSAASGSEVAYNADGNQSVAGVNYYSLTLSGSGTKTLAGDIGIAGELTLSGDAAFSYGSNRTVTYNGGNQTVAALDYYTLSFTGSTSGSTKTFADGTTKVETQIEITDSITLTGSSADKVTVQVTDPGKFGTVSRVFYIDASGENVTISNMTIKGGDIPDPNRGGSIYIVAGTVKLNFVTVSSGYAYYGGGIYNSGTLTLTSSTISGNDADENGGGIYNAGTLTLTSSTISGNDADENGGGIYNAGTLTINYSAISDNTVSYDNGGGIYNIGILTITSSTVSGNSSYFYGGGIYNSGTLTITSSTVSGNILTREFVTYGGGIYNSGTLTINSSTVSGNSITGTISAYGGGICNSGTLTINSSTICENSGGVGGGIYNDSNTTVNSSTICGNYAFLIGGGVVSPGTAIFTNSIVAYNYGPNYVYSDIDNLGTGTVYGNYNISYFPFLWTGGVGNIWYTYGTSGTSGMGSPLFAAYNTVVENLIYKPVLADNGGSTYTVALSSDSIAIGAGTLIGSYTESGITKYAFFDYKAYNWKSITNGSTVAAQLVTAIKTDQRGASINIFSPDVGAYYKSSTPVPVNNETVNLINDGTELETDTSWYNSIDSNDEDEDEVDYVIFSSELDPNQLDFTEDAVTSSEFSSQVTQGTSLTNGENGATDTQTTISSNTSNGEGDYGIGYSSQDEYAYNLSISGRLDGECIAISSSGANYEPAFQDDGLLDLTFNFDGSDDLINFEGMAVMTQKHPTFKTELDLLLEKI